jgi:hypothetical protein
MLRYRLHGDGRLTVQRAYEVGDDLERAYGVGDDLERAYGVGDDLERAYEVGDDLEWYDVELDIEEIEEANANSNMQSGSNLPSARNV